jgi:hypothetical protein
MFNNHPQPRKPKNVMGRTCVKPVRGTWEARGTTIHIVPHSLWVHPQDQLLSPTKTPSFAGFRTQTVHSLVDRITEVRTNLSPSSTLPTITTTT